MRGLIDYFLKHNGVIKIAPNYNTSATISFEVYNHEYPITQFMHCITRLDNMQCDSVIWDNFRTSINLTTFIRPYEEDSISFQFGGCLMARFQYMYLYYIAHIHMGENPALNSFCNYIKEDYYNLIIFRPLKSYRYGIEIDYRNAYNQYRIEVMGVIDRNGRCYSVLTYKSNIDFFVLGVAEHLGNHKVNNNIIRNLDINILDSYISESESYRVSFNYSNLKALKTLGIDIVIG